MRPESKRDAAQAVRPRVLVVGQPSPGGISTFIRQVVNDEWLRERAHVGHLPARIPTHARPGTLAAPNIRLALANALEIFRRARRFDIVHLNMAAAPVLPLVRALLFTLAAKAAGARVILQLHTGRIELSLERFLYRSLFRLTSRVVDLMMVVSRPAEAAARRVGVKVRRIENGLDAAPFATGPKDEPVSLLFVGTVCERKGLLDLKDALLELQRRDTPAPQVLVAGDGKQEGPGAFESVKRAYEHAGLSDVRFLGELPPDAVSALLGRSGIFCLPSHWEGFPLSILEAMASEAAVVASTVGDIPFILDHGRVGAIVEPHDPVSLADALQGLLADPQERGRLAKLGRARVEQEFGQDRVMRALLAIYSELAGRR